MRKIASDFRWSPSNAALLVELSFDHAVEPAWAMRARFPLQRETGVVSPARAKAFGGDVLRRALALRALADVDEDAAIGGGSADLPFMFN